jgi:hypothetical protein
MWGHHVTHFRGHSRKAPPWKQTLAFIVQMVNLLALDLGLNSMQSYK